MLVGSRLAVIPLGVSCQTAHQVELHRREIEKRAEESLDDARTPFDWRIVGPADVAAMIEADELFPTSVDELSSDRNRYWKRRSCWFWHDKFDDFSRFTSKQGHLVDNWRRIGEAKRKIFVISDTQNNLERVLKPFKATPPRVEPKGLEALAGVILARFGGAEVHLVTNRGWKMPVPELFTVHWIAPDRSSWQGDDTAWGRILDRIVTARPTRAAP